MKTNIFSLTLALLISLCILSACDDDDDFEIKILTISSHKELYYPAPFGDAQIEGYSVTDADGNQFHINTIKGFDEKFREGYKYVIKTKVIYTSPSKPTQDNLGSASYYLLEIISEEKETNSLK